MAIATLRTPKEAAQFLKLSTSWLAKARMRGDAAPIRIWPRHSIFRS
jgi:hypothetical protein